MRIAHLRDGGRGPVAASKTSARRPETRPFKPVTADQRTQPRHAQLAALDAKPTPSHEPTPSAERRTKIEIDAERAEKMKNQEKDVEEIYRRASAGAKAKISVPECLFLKQNLTQDRAFPAVCEQMLSKANRTGLLARRNSRVAKAWDISDGHGVRKMGVTEIPKVLDTVTNPAEQSANDIYLNSRSPEQQEKIRRLHVRTASRGAKPRTHDAFYGAPEVQKDVRTEVKRELVRRQSRREERRDDLRKAQSPLVV